jgi:hypothetical protein
MKISSRLSIGFLLLWIITYQGIAQDNSIINQEILAEFPNYNFPPIPIFIGEGETLRIYNEYWETSGSRLISGEGHFAIAQHCARSLRINRLHRESCEELWIQILDANSVNGWILYDYNILPNDENSERYDSHFIPYRQRLDSIDSPVTLYAYPNREAPVLENLNVDSYAFVYGFDYDETGVWYLVKYTLANTESTLTAWVHLLFPEDYHWYSPMPDLPHAFLSESLLPARSNQLGLNPTDFSIESGELLLMYNQAILSGYYAAGHIYNGDWQKFGIPLNAISFPLSVSRRVSMQRGE